MTSGEIYRLRPPLKRRIYSLDQSTAREGKERAMTKTGES